VTFAGINYCTADLFLKGEAQRTGGWRTTVSRRLSLPAVPVCVLPTLNS